MFLVLKYIPHQVSKHDDSIGTILQNLKHDSKGSNRASLWCCIMSFEILNRLETTQNIVDV